jgi:hypothetical protein
MARNWFKRLTLAIAAIGALAMGAIASDLDNPYVKGQFVVKMAANTTLAQATLMSNAKGMLVASVMRRPGYFVFALPDPNALDERAQMEENLTYYRNHPLIRGIIPNYIVEKHQIPNDPAFGPATTEQWNLFRINLPGGAGAWATHKGLAGVAVVDLDSDFDLDHPDFFDEFIVTRFLPGWNAYTETPDVRPAVPPPYFSHGTMTASVIIAGTNNGIGMAGVTWEGVKVAPVQIATPAPQAALTANLILNGYQWVVDYNRGGIPFVAQNMSYGGGSPMLLDEDYFHEIRSFGTILCASSGNSRPFPAGFPASYPYVVSIGATRYAAGAQGIPTSYSSPGTADGSRKVDLAAPSGDDPADAPVVALDYGGGVGGGGGTSYSCPTVVGAIALLYSAGMSRADIVQALKDTAVVAAGDPKPNLDTGWGEIDVAAAMALITPGIAPQIPSTDNVTFGYQTVHVKFRMFNIRTAGPAPTVTVEKADGSYSHVVSPSDYTVTADPVDPRVVFVEGKIRLSEAGSLDEADWKVIVEGTEVAPGVGVFSAERLIKVRYFVLPAGTSMASVPFGIEGVSSPPGGRKPETVYGADVVMHRWIPTGSGSYAMYSSALPNTQDAGFTPLSLEVIRTTHIGSSHVETPQNGPWGNGFWVTTSADSPMNFEQGPEDDIVSYKVKLKAGWNQVGNPYPFYVDWPGVLVQELPSQRILTIDQAATELIIRPQLYRYELMLDGSKMYTWKSPPTGQMIPFESHWIFAFEECYVIVQPTPAPQRLRSGAAAPPVRGEGWLKQVRVSNGKLQDAQNFFGMTRSVNPVFDQVAEPPTSPGGVGAWFEHASGSRLSQDVREMSLGKEEYRLRVRPVTAGADVVISWNDIVTSNRRQRLSIKDMATGRTLAMQPSGAYTFRADENVTPREFVITVLPDAAGKLVIGAVRIAGGSRGAGDFSIQYSLSADAMVTVRILGTTGKTIANLDSRSRSAGANAVSWNGRNTNGVAVAPGVYMVEITAETASGERARTTTPVTVTR